MKIPLTAVSFGLAVAAAAFLLIWPVYSGFDGNGPTRATLLAVNGPWVVLPVLFPVLTALLPLVFRHRAVRIAATILTGLFVLIAGFSIGLFYLPAALAMLLAACMTQPARYTTGSSAA